jgi:hypothetical protein
MKVLKKDIKHLSELLTNTEIPINYQRARKDRSKTPAGKGRSVLLGYAPYFKNRLTNFTKEHPDIYEELMELGRKYADFPVTQIMLNKNYQTQKHKDSMNVGKSIIFSFGDYTGGELIMEDDQGKPHVLKTHMNTVEMDGSKHFHWNKPITSGTKYSVIFFRIK